MSEPPFLLIELETHFHIAAFDLYVTTGVCVANPSAKVERYDVQVDGSDVKVRL